MATPRRKIIRLPPSPLLPIYQQIQRERLQARLERELAALGRWKKRLKRAFNAIAKHEQCLARLQRRLRHQETPHESD